MKLPIPHMLFLEDDFVSIAAASTSAGPLWCSSAIPAGCSIFVMLPLKNPPLVIARESVTMFPETRPVLVISTSPVATMSP